MSLLDIFQYDFLLRAFLAGLIISVLAPIIGMFLVVRRYAFLADTLAHVSLLGVALALFFHIPTVIGAIIVSVGAALGIDRLRLSGRMMNDATLALFLSVSLAAAVVLVSTSGVSNVNLMSYLFGSLSTVSRGDVWLLAIISTAAIVILAFFYRSLFLISLDEDLARVSGIRVGIVHGGFLVFAAMTAALSLQIVGVLLLGALMVIPVLSALQFGRGFRSTLFLSLLFSLASFFIGFVFSYVFGLPSGGTIVLSAGGLFFLAFLSTRLR